jgi:hypothetical protein
MGWESFEPWLSRIEALEEGKLWEIAEAVPPEWYGGDTAELERLMEQMMARQGRVREWIEEFRGSGREPFPNWAKSARVVVPRGLGELDGVGRFVM